MTDCCFVTIIMYIFYLKVSFNLNEKIMANSLNIRWGFFLAAKDLSSAQIGLGKSFVNHKDWFNVYYFALVSTLWNGMDNKFMKYG